MTEEELEKEKEAEEYARKNYGLKYAVEDDCRRLTPEESACMNGYLAGTKAHLPQWHDLRKNPEDLPKDYRTLCICLKDFGSKYEPIPQVYVGYCDSLGWSDYMGSSLYSNVRYWCELPKLEEKVESND